MLTYKEFTKELEYLMNWHRILIEQEGSTKHVTRYHQGLVQKLRAANYKHSMRYAKDNRGKEQ
tara:strand:- start:138 stop:326 length:189 start_codon:yes stop_codon:yes gene_type:complete